MDARIFFAAVRQSLFGGRLTQNHVEGTELLVRYALERDYDTRWIAYALGTAYHETARTMMPIREFGEGRGKPYGVPHPATKKIYFGRGFVQLTWYENYLAMSRRLEVDLVDNPGLALDPPIATAVLWTGMVEGMFDQRNRRGFDHYFTPSGSDWVQARRMVNLTDRAHEIARISALFYRALLQAGGRPPVNFSPMENVIIAGMDTVLPDELELERQGILAEDPLDELEVSFV